MKITKNHGIMLFVLILALQLIYMIYWGNQKSGFYVDEFFTFDNTHYISASTPKRIKLYDADFLTYNEWHKVSDLKSTLTVTKEESMLNDSFGYNIKRWIKGHPYMIILNYAEALFFDGILNIWSAISLNIVFFLINQVILYSLTFHASKSREAAIMAVALYGFSGMAASMTIYIRFYMLVTMWMTLFTYLHILMWECSTWWKNLILELCSLSALYLAYRDSPLAAVQGAATVLFFLAALIIKKKYNQALWYGVPVIGGGLLFVIFRTNYLWYLINPSKYADAGVSNTATASLLGNFIAMTPQNAIARLEELAHIICRYLFGHSLILAGYVLLVIVLWVLCMKKKNIKETLPGSSFWMLSGSCVLFCVVSVCLKLGTIRYNSSIFPELSVCLAIWVIALAKNVNSKRTIGIAMSAIILGEVIFTIYVPRVDYLYREDRPAIEAIQTLKGIDSVVVDYHFDDRVMYECLVYTDEETNVMFTSYENIDYHSWAEKVLMWQNINQDQKAAEDLMHSEDYLIEEVGRTHESIVYLVTRQST